jgi:hypothetical protein
LVHRGGLYAQILHDGEFAVGDSIVAGFEQQSKRRVGAPD